MTLDTCSSYRTAHIGTRARFYGISIYAALGSPCVCTQRHIHGTGTSDWRYGSQHVPSVMKMWWKLCRKYYRQTVSLQCVNVSAASRDTWCQTSCHNRYSHISYHEQSESEPLMPLYSQTPSHTFRRPVPLSHGYLHVFWRLPWWDNEKDIYCTWSLLLCSGGLGLSRCDEGLWWYLEAYLQFP